MSRKKLSGSVDLLHVYIDKGKQMKGIKAIKERKRQEQKLINLAKFRRQNAN